MCCTYLHRCIGLAGVIDANFPVFAHCGKELAICAPRHAKDLNIIRKEEGEGQRTVGVFTPVCVSKHVQMSKNDHVCSL